MSENQLKLEKRTVVGKKIKALRASGLIPSVVYGAKKDNIITQSNYNDTEKILKVVGHHSPVNLLIDGKEQMAIVKDVSVDPVSRKIISIDFQAVSATEVVEATTPITIINFETSEASKKHYAILHTLEEIDVKAKPADLPKEVTVDAANMSELDDKITVADLALPKGVELADKELSPETVIANLYDPAAEAAAREAEEAAAAEAEPTEAADVPADNGSKPEEASAEEKAE
ncbi:50S ribosomal protein L25 [Candidatus Saccharibacteria bacterium]|nr:50S ribosomal protein L25 [Candidatus Saccharibacteria bacterium]